MRYIAGACSSVSLQFSQVLLALNILRPLARGMCRETLTN